MRALVLSAGYGTRLGDLTRLTPKPMLLIHGRPILEYIILNLASQGIREIVVNVHFMPEMIRDYFGSGAQFGVELMYSYEPTLLGTAGTVRKLAPFLAAEGSFLVHYGDILTDQSFLAMREFHNRRAALATLLLHRRAGSNSVVTLDAEGRIINFLERPAPGTVPSSEGAWVNSGVHICSSEIIDRIPDCVPCDFPKDVFPGQVPSGRLFGYSLSGYRCAIDSAARLAEAAAAVGRGACRVDSPLHPTDARPGVEEAE